VDGNCQNDNSLKKLPDITINYFKTIAISKDNFIFAPPKKIGVLDGPI
jgi:hypothetical protein